MSGLRGVGWRWRRPPQRRRASQFCVLVIDGRAAAKEKRSVLYDWTSHYLIWTDAAIICAGARAEGGKGNGKGEQTERHALDVYSRRERRDTWGAHHNGAGACTRNTLTYNPLPSSCIGGKGERKGGADSRPRRYNRRACAPPPLVFGLAHARASLVLYSPCAYKRTKTKKRKREKHKQAAPGTRTKRRSR